MAEAAGSQAVALHLKIFAVPVLCAHLDIVRARDLTEHTGNAEAPLSACLFAGILDDLRIDQFIEDLVLILFHIGLQNNNSAAQNAYLRCRQANAAALQQCISQIVQQLMQPVVKISNHAALLSQYRILLCTYYSDCHIHIS